MTRKPTELLTQTVPELVNAAVAQMKHAGEAGDEKAAARYRALLDAPGAIRIVLEGKRGADVYLVSENAVMQASPSAPSAPVLFALAVAAEAAEIGLEELADEVEQTLEVLRKQLAFLSPRRVRAVLDRLASERLSFHAVVRDTPDFDEVRVRIATGSAEPPSQPAFTVSIAYDTLEQLRQQKLKPQALLSKLTLSGDSSRAMQLAMELMQRRGA